MAAQFKKSQSKEKQESFERPGFSLGEKIESLEEQLARGSHGSVVRERAGGSAANEHMARQIPTVLARGSFLEGSFSFDQPTCLEGTLFGKINSASALLVSESALVEAETSVDKLIVYGSFKGEVMAKDLVEVFPGASLSGQIKAKRMIVHEGAQINAAFLQVGGSK